MISAMIPYGISLHALLIDDATRGAGVVRVGFHLDNRLRHRIHMMKLHEVTPSGEAQSYTGRRAAMIAGDRGRSPASAAASSRPSH